MKVVSVFHQNETNNLKSGPYLANKNTLWPWQYIKPGT